MIKKTDNCVDELRCIRYNSCKGKCQEKKENEKDDLNDKQN